MFFFFSKWDNYEKWIYYKEKEILLYTMKTKIRTILNILEQMLYKIDKVCPAFNFFITFFIPNNNILYRSIKIKVQQVNYSYLFVIFPLLKMRMTVLTLSIFMSIIFYHKSFELMFPMLMLTSTFWHRIS